MTFDLTVNGKSQETFDLDPAYVDHILINESIKVPVLGNSADITIRVIPKSPKHIDVINKAEAERQADLESEIADAIEPQENPTVVALEAEFGAQPAGQILPSDSELKATASDEEEVETEEEEAETSSDEGYSFTSTEDS